MSDQKPESKTVLVIDDDESMRTFFAAVLDKEGFNVAVEASSENALIILEDFAYQKFDLLVLDLMMPVVSGQVIVKELQKSGYQKLPVILVTGREWDKDSISKISQEPNVAGFWQKPIDIEPFTASLHKILGTTPRPRKEVLPKVLLLDDNYIVTDTLSRILKMLDFETTVAGDGAKALNYLAFNRPQLIIADVDIIKKDSWALLSNLRREENMKNVPVLFMADKHENISELMSHGSALDDYITKPFEGKDLLDSVRGLLSEKGRAV